MLVQSTDVIKSVICKQELESNQMVKSSPAF